MKVHWVASGFPVLFLPSFFYRVLVVPEGVDLELFFVASLSDPHERVPPHALWVHRVVLAFLAFT